MSKKLTQTSPLAGSNVTVLPGYSGVPLWSVLPAKNIPNKVLIKKRCINQSNITNIYIYIES